MVSLLTYHQVSFALLPIQTCLYQTVSHRFYEHCLVFSKCSCKLSGCLVLFHMYSHYCWQLTNLLKVLYCWKIWAFFLVLSCLLNGETSLPSPSFWHMKESVQSIYQSCTDSVSGETNINFRLGTLKNKYRGVLFSFVCRKHWSLIFVMVNIFNHC